MNRLQPLALALCSIAFTLTSCSSDDDAAPVDESFTPEDLPAQTGSLVVTPSTGEVVVNDLPDLNMTASASYNSGSSELTVNVGITSEFENRILFNPKLWITDVSPSDASQALDTTVEYASTFEGTDYVYYGPGAMPIMGNPINRQMVFENVASDTDFTINVSLTDSPSLLARDNWDGLAIIDSGTGLYWGTVECEPMDWTALDPDAAELGAGSTCGLRSWTVKYDGTQIFTAGRNHPSIAAIDSTTGDYSFLNIGPTGDANDVGHIHYISQSADGSKIYALLMNGVHTAPWDHNCAPGNCTDDFDVTTAQPVVEIVEVDADSFTINQRGTVVTLENDGYQRAVSVDVSPDGSMLAVLVNGETEDTGVYLVNATDLTVMSGMPIALADGQVFPKKAVFASDSKLAVAYGGYWGGTVADDSAVNGDVLTLINTTAPYEATDVTPAITSSGSINNLNMGSLVRDENGNAYWSRMWNDANAWEKDAAPYAGSELLSIIDSSDGSETLVQLEPDAYAGDGRRLGGGVAVGPEYIYVANGIWNTTDTNIAKIDRVTGERVDFDGDLTDSIVGNSDMDAEVADGQRVPYNHELVLTPF